MTIGDGEKVTVLEATEVRHGDPRILVLLVWVGRRLSCFSSEGKLCYAVGVHLSRVGRVVRVLLLGVSLPTASLLLFRVGENRLRLALTCLVASLWVLHLLWVLWLWVGLHIHRCVLGSQGHLLWLDMLRLLNNWRLIWISLEVSVLICNLRQLIWIYGTAFWTFKESIQVALWALVTTRASEVVVRLRVVLGANELLSIMVVVQGLVWAEKTVVHLRFHLRLFTRD